MKKHPIHIIKSTGKSATFEEGKLRYSLQQSGASPTLIDKIVDKVKEILYYDMSTREIYEIAFDMLLEHEKPTAARYKLKKAIMELGPSGFPFEKFVAEVLKMDGYTTELNAIVSGNCIEHEIDVLARKNELLYLTECKFHSDPSRNCNVKVPLYIHSRFNDVVSVWKKDSNMSVQKYRAWIVTNTRFTKDAIIYASCSNIRLMGWDFPKGSSLKERIDRNRVHPITSLSSLLIEEKEQLLEMDLVLCRQLWEQQGILFKIGISAKRQAYILEELEALCLDKS